MQIQKRIDLHKDRQTLYFTVANFRHDYFKYYVFAKLQRESLPLIHPGGSRRRQ